MERPTAGIVSPDLLRSSMLVGGTMVMALSVYWDAWWHEAVGRESFWIPPHLGIYTGLFISLGGFLLLLHKYGRQLPRTLWVYAAGMASVIVSGYADELWHQEFGIEEFGTLESVWSPTHAGALAGGITASLGIIFYLLDHNNRGSWQRWLLAAQFGVLVSIATLLLLPLGPETPFRLMGIWGAPVIAFAILTMRFLGSALSETPWALSLITGYNWTGNAVLLSNHASTGLLAALLCVGLVPPFLADIIIQRGRRMKTVKKAYVLAGFEWGVIFGAFFYPLANGLTFVGDSTVLDPFSLAVIGVTSAAASLLAGYFAGVKSQQWMRDKTLLVARAESPVGVTS